MFFSITVCFLPVSSCGCEESGLKIHVVGLDARVPGSCASNERANDCDDDTCDVVRFTTCVSGVTRNRDNRPFETLASVCGCASSRTPGAWLNAWPEVSACMSNVLASTCVHRIVRHHRMCHEMICCCCWWLPGMIAAFVASDERVRSPNWAAAACKTAAKERRKVGSGGGRAL